MVRCNLEIMDLQSGNYLARRSFICQTMASMRTAEDHRINISVVFQNSGSGSKCATEGTGEDINV